MFNKELNQVVYVLRDRVNGHGESISNIWTKFREFEEKINALYKRDYHGFSRPKVDILEDNTGDTECAVWESISKLQKRIEELEGKKK
jgi:hypothetical protein